MHTDTIFYQIFLTFHSLLFELLGQPIENAEGYQFTSVEVKEKAFRFDGIFRPDRVKSLFLDGFLGKFCISFNCIALYLMHIMDRNTIASLLFSIVKLSICPCY